MSVSTILIKRLQAAITLLFCLFFMAFAANPVLAQDDKPPPPPPGGYELAIPTMETTVDDKPPPPPPGGYERQSHNATDALTASSLAAEQTKPALLGNYPNPFNPGTTIRFAVQEGQQVRLTVFNLLGQRVRVLVDSYLDAGQHEARFVAQDLPSGTYFTRLETRTGIAIQQMVLMK